MTYRKIPVINTYTAEQPEKEQEVIPTVTSIAVPEPEGDKLTSLDRVDVQLDSNSRGSRGSSLITCVLRDLPWGIKLASQHFPEDIHTLCTVLLIWQSHFFIFILDNLKKSLHFNFLMNSNKINQTLFSDVKLTKQTILGHLQTHFLNSLLILTDSSWCSV